MTIGRHYEHQAGQKLAQHPTSPSARAVGSMPMGFLALFTHWLTLVHRPGVAVSDCARGWLLLGGEPLTWTQPAGTAGVRQTTYTCLALMKPAVNCNWPNFDGLGMKTAEDISLLFAGFLARLHLRTFQLETPGSLHGFMLY